MPAIKIRDMAKIFAGIPSGDWVALSNDEVRVLAHSPEFDAAIRAARELGEDDPVIARVPPFDRGLLIL